MAEDKKNRRPRKVRQEWDPHWLLKLCYTAFSVAMSLVKIAIGAAATVLLIVLICGTVFVGILGNYLQDDILTEAANWSLEDYDLERTSFIYYVDGNGDIQQLHQKRLPGLHGHTVHAVVDGNSRCLPVVRGKDLLRHPAVNQITGYQNHQR